ncbi:DNA polymerase III subunit epsilon [Ignavibacterium album JCM 16511]|uniref:DNA polymerase III subunit epsilon n=1 Tax=Ignavibacterium album (strain DSM 19864 / JCM 16511 / NBRC 101810 / Mat9-16) TaxID=945713 RepID=I0AKY5_IGNAJ|nr:3'-5' exonuclease [Ignavibacterium album]AFH49642.1 DNA polymerase III subunit epsilon [Ignavibacterium album JCM 16511]
MKNSTIKLKNSQQRYPSFLAIDFETANYYRDSACALGLVRVENCKIVAKESFLIRPPSQWFVFTDLHGITWEDVKDAPTFSELWPDIKKYFRGVDFITAHNAPFDRSVLMKCCERYRIEPPQKPFICTMQLSRSFWGFEYYRLNDVCDYFSIQLNHHEALSDALACAKIMIKTLKSGYLLRGK